MMVINVDKGSSSGRHQQNLLDAKYKFFGAAEDEDLHSCNMTIMDTL
jgi:hypothetical protein